MMVSMSTMTMAVAIILLWRLGFIFCILFLHYCLHFVRLLDLENYVRLFETEVKADLHSFLCDWHQLTFAFDLCV